MSEELNNFLAHNKQKPFPISYALSGQQLNSNSEIKEPTRSKGFGFFADALKKLKGNMNYINIPYLGGAGDLILGESPRLADDISYQGLSALVRGGNVATGGIGTYGLKPETVDLAGVITGLGGIARPVASSAGRAALPLAKDFAESVGARQLKNSYMGKNQIGAVNPEPLTRKSSNQLPDVLRGKISSPPTGKRFGFNVYKNTVDQELSDIADSLDEGLSIREALREVNPQENKTFDLLLESNPPKIDLNVPNETLTVSYDDFSGAKGFEDFGDVIFIENIDANPLYKGKGFSRSALVKEVLNIQKENPGKSIILNAEPKDDSLSLIELVQLYRSIGFEPTGIDTGSTVNMKFEGFPEYVKKQIKK